MPSSDPGKTAIPPNHPAGRRVYGVTTTPTGEATMRLSPINYLAYRSAAISAVPVHARPTT